MPATSEKQRTMACIALAIKKGETPASYSKEAAEWAKSASLESLEETCHSKVKK